METGKFNLLDFFKNYIISLYSKESPSPETGLVDLLNGQLIDSPSCGYTKHSQMPVFLINSRYRK